MHEQWQAEGEFFALAFEMGVLLPHSMEHFPGMFGKIPICDCGPCLIAPVFAHKFHGAGLFARPDLAHIVSMAKFSHSSVDSFFVKKTVSVEGKLLNEEKHLLHLSNDVLEIWQHDAKVTSHLLDAPQQL